MSRGRVLVLMNDYAAPPPNAHESNFDREEVDWVMHYDVIKNLKELGYDVRPFLLSNDIHALKQSIEDFDPHIVFNLLFEFAGESILDQNVMSYLELLNIPFTGSSPRSLVLARNKATAKKILRYHNLNTPDFCVFPKDQPIKNKINLKFPVIVKCVCEDASLGISLSSLVNSEELLYKRVKFLHENYASDAIAEEFIPGREISVSIVGNKRLRVFPAWELLFTHSEAPEQEFYHYYAKWNTAYRKRKGICSKKADISSSLERELAHCAKAVFRGLGLNGYARIDFRLTASGELFVIEANANPDISKTEDFSMSAKASGINYKELLQKIVSMGLRAQSPKV